MQKHSLLKKIFLICSIFCTEELSAQLLAPQDSLQRKKQYSYFLNWKDQPLNRFNYTYSPFLNVFPTNEKSSVLFNPKQSNFTLEDKLNNKIDTKIPQSMSFSEYSEIQEKMLRKSIMRDFEKASDGNSATSGSRSNPILDKNSVLDRIFGGKIPEFKPAGYLGFKLGIIDNYTENPSVSPLLRHQSTLDAKPEIGINFNNFFNGQSTASSNPEIDKANPNVANKTTDVVNMARQMNQAKEKMNILGNFDTKSSFGYENKFKINFKNDPEDILQKLEIGNISMPSRSQLIPGVQNLLGVKTAVRFGKLDITGVIAQQKSKTESIYINGGNQSRPFEIRTDAYDENKHFFISQFFRDKYENAMKTIPNITSGVKITRIEVYVTNRTASMGISRNVVGLTDLGETSKLSNTNTTVKALSNAVDNKNNVLLDIINYKDSTNSRNADAVLGFLQSNSVMNLRNKDDFEVLHGAKRLTEKEFEFNADLGYISLQTPLRNDEVLAVSYEYAYKGANYKVGEMTEDYAKIKDGQVIYLKLLKSSTLRNNLKNPMWNLMMKNVYSLPVTQVKREGFQLRVIYKDDKTGLDSPYLPEISLTNSDTKKTLLNLTGLDNLNFNNDPLRDSKGVTIGDGNFDFVEGVTINSRLGKIIFPVLEPFGSDLRKTLTPIIGETNATRYVFDSLYTRTMSDAQQINYKAKFFLSGSVQSGGADIPLPIGATGASVRVFAGGTELKQGSDFLVDPQMGLVKITNQSILSSGRSIRIDFEKPDMFQSQVRRFMGLRLDYMIGRYLHLGGTAMSLKENTPGAITRTAIGNEPVNNTLFGLDVNLKKNSYGITKFLDNLPGLQTKEISSIILNAEYAQLKAGVNKKVNGNSMIDDFEFARNINDLARQTNKWRLGSVPVGFDGVGIQKYQNRAKISAYTVDPSAFVSGGYGSTGNLIPKQLQDEARQNLYEKPYQIQEIFPAKSTQVVGQQLPTSVFDISYFPSEPGMYNYNTQLTADGKLKNPLNNFGSIMRGVTFDSDFENSNIEYFEFWMLDPFKDNIRNGSEILKNKTGGKLLIQLGDVSEDVIPDGVFGFENGMNRGGTSSVAGPGKLGPFGYAPVSQYVTDAFDNDPEIRKSQDVGLDGLSNENEKTTIKVGNDTYLNALTGLNPTAKSEITADPAKDDFKYFLDPSFTETSSIITRFKNYLGMENNSPIATTTATAGNTQVTLAQMNTADKEDINQDNNINDLESYFQYEVPLQPDKLDVGNGYIVDKVVGAATATGVVPTWYLFRIPIKKVDKYVNRNDNGFKSVRFVRLVTTQWAEPVVMRFAAMQLVSNQYRKYNYKISNSANDEQPIVPGANEKFAAATVNVEEDGCPTGGNCNLKAGAVPYMVPPGFIRDRDYTNIKSDVQFNEQSLSLAVENLGKNEARSVFKNVKMDLNMYEKIKMAVHAHSKDDPMGSNKYAGLFIRLGTDNINNYYEIEIPSLKNTQISNSVLNTDVWPTENEIDVPLDLLRNLKMTRNKDVNAKFDQIYSPDALVAVPGTNSSDGSILANPRYYKLKVMGNPDLSNILSIMIGLKNIDNNTASHNFTIWTDELRTNGYKINDANSGKPGNAYVFSTDIKLADIGNLMLSANHKSAGFGGLQDRISSRSRDASSNFAIATNLALDKFLPRKWGLSIPFFGNFDSQKSTPYYNPLDPDIKLKDASLFGHSDPNDPTTYLNNAAIQAIASDKLINRGFNFTNVRKTKMGLGNLKDHFYDVENFTISFAFNNIHRTSMLLQKYDFTQRKAGLSYMYSPKGISWSPFSKIEKYANPGKQWIKDFNINPIPSMISFRSDYNQNTTSTQYRSASLNATDANPATVIGYFLGNRLYNVAWNLSKSMTLNYEALMVSIQDSKRNDRFNPNDPNTSFGAGLLNFKARPKTYTQKSQLTWRLPLDKIYFLDWIKADARLITTFGYKAGSFMLTDNGLAPDASGKNLLGNLIDNTKEQSISGQVDLIKLYNKIRFLRLANTPAAPLEKFTRSPGDDEIVIVKNRNASKSLVRLLMTVRGINMTYGKVETTQLPGFLGMPQMMGMDLANGNAPGANFALFGAQNAQVINRIKSNWLTKSDSINNPIIQTRGVKFEYNTSLEPFNGLKIQIKGNRTRNDSYQEIYNDGVVRSPMRNGNFNMSFWSFNTIFTKISEKGPDYTSPLFNTMLTNRQLVLNKMPKNGDIKYDLNSQDILLTAFYAAYRGKSVDQVMKGDKLNLFSKLPLPNWRIDWSGLEKLPFLQDIFKSITINHQYNSTIAVGNYTSSLEYAINEANRNNLLLSQRNYLYSGTSTPTGNNLLPVFIMSTVTLEENFSPLIGMNFITKSKVSGMLNFNKQRSAQLNLSNASLTEQNKNGIICNIGFVKNNVRLPLRGRDGNSIVLKNDLNFKIDFSLSKNKAFLRKVGGDVTPISGAHEYAITPTLNYQINRKINIGLNYARRVLNPFVSNSFYTRTNTFMGNVRFNLAD